MLIRTGSSVITIVMYELNRSEWVFEALEKASRLTNMKGSAVESIMIKNNYTILDAKIPTFVGSFSAKPDTV